MKERKYIYKVIEIRSGKPVFITDDKEEANFYRSNHFMGAKTGFNEEDLYIRTVVIR